MSSKPAILIENVSKSYNIYAAPHDRLKQMFLPRLRRSFGLQPVKYFKAFQALEKISFEVGRGEAVGIIGRNGSGKSTLLQIICGTLSPSTGQVVKNGRTAALLELGAGFNPEFTGRENAALNAAILGLSQEEIETLMPQIEAFADVGEFFDRSMLTYSSGMYVRVAFAVQALIEPEILIVDEALAVGDAEFQAKCYDHIRKLKAAGTSILFVSHDISAVRQLCDRAIWIDAGSVRMSGSIYTVTSEYTRRLFDGEQSGDMRAPDDNTVLDLERSPDASSEVSSGAELNDDTSPTPLNHWGSHLGTVKRVYTSNGRGDLTRSFQDRDTIKVSVELDLPDDIPRETLSVAFSVKNLAGLDLIVGSTWKRDRPYFAGVGRNATVHFSFENVLNANDYVISIGVEDRLNSTPAYYEHIEGIAYIRIETSERHYGLVTPVIDTVLDLELMRHI